MIEIDAVSLPNARDPPEVRVIGSVLMLISWGTVVSVRSVVPEPYTVIQVEMIENDATSLPNVTGLLEVSVVHGMMAKIMKI